VTAEVANELWMRLPHEIGDRVDGELRQRRPFRATMAMPGEGAPEPAQTQPRWRDGAT
jgi:hypothetical protein